MKIRECAQKKQVKNVYLDELSKKYCKMSWTELY